MKNLSVKYKKYLIMVTTIILLVAIGIVYLTTGNNTLKSKVSNSTTTSNFYSVSKSTTTTIPPKTLPSVPLVPPKNWNKIPLQQMNTDANAQITLGALVGTLDFTLPDANTVTSISYVVTRLRDIPPSFFGNDTQDQWAEGFASDLEHHNIIILGTQINFNTVVVLMYATGEFWVQAGAGMGVSDNSTGCGQDLVPTSEGGILSCTPISHGFFGFACVGVGVCESNGLSTNYSFDLSTLGKVITIPPSQWSAWGLLIPSN